MDWDDLQQSMPLRLFLYGEVYVSMGHVRRKPKLLSQKLVLIREHLGIVPMDMARKLGVARKLEVTTHRLSSYESGKSEPTLMELLVYGRLVGVPMDSIVDDAISVNAFRGLLGKSIAGQVAGLNEY